MTIELTHSTTNLQQEVVAEEMEPDDVAPIMIIAPNLDEAHRTTAERNQRDFMARMQQRMAEVAALRCVDRPTGLR